MASLDFAAAKLKHQTWKLRLRRFLDGEETLTLAQATSPRDCDLGKWLYADGLRQYGTLPEMKELERVHAELHATVKRIVELKAQGSPAAEQEYAKIGPISETIIGLLTTIERKVA